MAFHKKRLLKKKTSKKRSYKKHAKKTTFASKVLKVVRKAEETKMVAYSSNFNIGNYTSVVPSQAYVSPNPTSLNISQGTQAGQRVGDKVHVKKVILRGILIPLPQVAVTNYPMTLQECRVIVGRNRLSGQALLPSANLFTLGDTDIPPVGILPDMLYPINKQAISVYKDKCFKLGYAGYTANTTTAMTTDNDFKANAKFVWDITKACPKTLVWTSGVGGTPIFESPIAYLMAWTAPADGTTQAAQAACVNMTYEVEVHFVEI
nr:MAG: capsid protein [Cressdnaviricota sp.]